MAILLPKVVYATWISVFCVLELNILIWDKCRIFSHTQIFDMSFKRSFHGTTSNTILFEEQPSGISNTHEGVGWLLTPRFITDTYLLDVTRIYHTRSPWSYWTQSITQVQWRKILAIVSPIGPSISCFGTANEILLQITFCLLAKISLGGIFRKTHYRLSFEHLVTIFSPP